MGDGVLAYFGYPQTHEYDAERAVRAGLALVEAVPKLTTAAHVPLQVRVGLATGLVVVGDLIGAGGAQEQAVVGETPNLAARLQALAEPSAVVIASTTQALTGGLFEYRDLGVVALKGFAENVRAWQVLGAGAAESRFEALRTMTTPLVGRSGLAQVIRPLGEDGLQLAQPLFVVVVPPKASCPFKLTDHRVQDAVLMVRRAEIAQARVYLTGQEVLDRLSNPRFSDAGLARDQHELPIALLGLPPAPHYELEFLAPLLAELLSIPTANRYPLLNLTPQKRKEKTLKALLAQVEGLAAKQPVLMVFEDAHWIDPTSRDALDIIIDRAPALRVLAIVTFRPEFTPPWVGRPQVTILTIHRLPSRQRAEMIRGVIGGKALPKEIADQIIGAPMAFRCSSRNSPKQWLRVVPLPTLATITKSAGH
jgi:hypothetical protein